MCDYTVKRVCDSIFFAGDINHVSMSDLKASICESLSEETIPTIYIDSHGGNPYQALGMADFLCCLSVDIKTVVCGEAASSASIVSLAAKPENRLMTVNSVIYVHEFKSHVSGVPKEIQSDGKECERLNSVIADYYASRTNVSHVGAVKMLADYTYLDYNNALCHGFVSGAI